MKTKEKVLGGLRIINTKMPQAVTLKILQNKDGGLQLRFIESGIFNEETQIVILDTEIDPDAQEICQKLRELAELINKQHEKNPENTLFVPKKN